MSCDFPLQNRGLLVTEWLSWLTCDHKIKARYTRCKFCIQVSIQVSWIQVFWSCIHTRNLNQKTWTDLDGIEMHPIFFQLGWNLDGDWPIRRQNPYQHQFVNVNNNNYTCCAKMAGKEETPKCRKKTVTWTNEMIEDLIDFIEIHPIVAFEAIYEPMLTSFWSLISFAVQLYIIMQYKGQHPPLLPKMPFCLLYLPPKLVCIHQNFLHRVYTNLNSSFLDPSFLEWRLGCKTCIVYTGLKAKKNKTKNPRCTEIVK